MRNGLLLSTVFDENFPSMCVMSASLYSASLERILHKHQQCKVLEMIRKMRVETSEWNLDWLIVISPLVVEIWRYLTKGYTFGEESEIQEICRKMWKKSIFHRDFDQKIAKSSWKFSKFSSVLVQTRKALHAGNLILPAQWKSFLTSWWSCIFLQITVDFLQKFQAFSCHFQ